MSIVNYMRRRVYTNFDVNEDGDVKKVCVCAWVGGCAPANVTVTALTMMTTLYSALIIGTEI